MRAPDGYPAAVMLVNADDETVALEAQEQLSLIEALGLPHERDYRLRRLLGDIALRRGWRPTELFISWATHGPIVHHRIRR